MDILWGIVQWVFTVIGIVSSGAFAYVGYTEYRDSKREKVQQDNTKAMAAQLEEIKSLHAQQHEEWDTKFESLTYPYHYVDAIYNQVDRSDFFKMVPKARAVAYIAVKDKVDIEMAEDIYNSLFISWQWMEASKNGRF